MWLFFINYFFFLPANAFQQIWATPLEYNMFSLQITQRNPDLGNFWINLSQIFVSLEPLQQKHLACILRELAEW